MAEPFKPNIYPILYWAIAYGVIAGVLLLLLLLLSRFITLVWFPVFLVGLVWGGYRNYKKQKRIWSTQTGVPIAPKNPMEEFREAVSDVVDASREMVAQHRAEDAEIAAAETEAAQEQEEESESLPLSQTEGEVGTRERPTP